jgi:hypothetical protein
MGKHRAFAGLTRRPRASFNANGERQVSGAINLWFRNGGHAGRPPRFPVFRPSIENLRRIEPFGFSANFRRFYLNANTCGLSTTVNQEKTCGH